MAPTRFRRPSESYRDAFYQSKYSNSLVVSCLFGVDIPNSRLFAVPFIRILNFIPS